MSRWLFFPTQATGGTVYDTYTQASNLSFGAGYWKLTSVSGSWTSTGTADGTYASATANLSPIQTQFASSIFRLDDNSLTWDTSKKIRVSFNGGTEVDATYTGTGNGGRFEFSPDVTLTSADIAPGGSLGWGSSDLVIKVIDS